MRFSPLTRSLALLVFFTAGSLRAYDAPPEPGTLIRRVAFGSCNSPLDATPV
jgi:hypothetical protein